MDASFHESDDRLELYALGRLPDSELIVVEEHLLACDACRGRLDTTAHVAFAIRENLKSHPVVYGSGRRWLGWLNVEWLKVKPQFAFAGALAMLILGVAVMRSGNSPLAPVASLQMTAMRGVEFRAVPPSRELDLTFGDADSALNVEVVDARGVRMWSGMSEMAHGVVQARIAKTLPQGEYFARVYDSPGHLLHEYGFQVRK